MTDIVVSLKPQLKVTSRDRWRARLLLPIVFILVRRQPEQLNRSLKRMAHGRPAASRQLVERAMDSIVAVSKRCAGRYCLDRATATAVFCWSEGYWPEWHAGAAIDPFRAHAWVSVDGDPVREPTSLNKYFVTMVSVFPDDRPRNAEQG